MPTTPTVSRQRVNGVHLFCEEHGTGAPILCIHGAGSSALAWAGAVERLARLGRVIAYDRRGCGRSERPHPYERTTPGEHADDAAALLDARAATPAVVIGRSYGGGVACELVLRHPECVRALVLLEPDAPGLSRAADAWVTRFSGHLREVAEGDGIDAVGEALIREVAGQRAWRAFPEEVRRMFTANGPAILAELAGLGGPADLAALARVEQPALILTAAGSPPELREAPEALADVLPNARAAVVGGDHLIDPAAPEVLAFVAAVLDERSS